MRRFISVTIVLIAFATTSVFADVYIKQKSHTDEFSVMGQTQPAKDEINDIWIGKDKFAMHSKAMAIIIDLNANKMYWVNHASKSFVPMDLPLDLANYFPPQWQKMMEGVSITVNPTGEEKTINNWKCGGYDVTMNVMMMKMKMKTWASPDVPFDWKAYNEKLFPMFAQAMMRLDEKSVKEFLKIKGYTIRQEMTMDMMGSEMKSWQQVVEISKKPAPDGTYSPPNGYTKKDKFDMMDMQKR